MNERMVVNTRNRMLSQHLQMTLDTRHTDLNNNILVFGGSGSGKTFKFVTPNLMQMSSSFVITDPKGEILRSSGGFLKAYGYDLKVLNLLSAAGMKKSSKYNPFRYITNDTDIVKMVTTYMNATKKKEAQNEAQFWDDMAGLLLQGIFYYVYYEGLLIDGKLHRDFKAVMRLINMLKVEEDLRTGERKKSEIDRLFAALERRNPNHPAVVAYNKAMVGAADTVRSIISTLISRTTCLQTEEILELLTDDEIDIKTIGMRKTAVFCVIPDNDKTYNFLVSILYQQMFQQLYHQADFVYGGSLPVHVTFMLDEFANIALPDDFCSLLSTMRSRNISSIIIIQNMAQIKALFKDTWETIPGNCDVLIYLGGNEQSTHEYLSKLLGKGTIDKRTHGQSKGKQGSSSSNDDVIGRELMLPEEVRKMSRKKCLIIISGKDPVIDDKINTTKHPLWHEFCRLSKEYQFDGRIERYSQNTVLIKKGGNVEQIKVLSVQEAEVLKQENKRIQEEYLEEKRVADLTGSEAPQTPTAIIQTFSLGDLMRMSAEVQTEEKEYEEFPEGETEEEMVEEAFFMAEECFVEEGGEGEIMGALIEHYGVDSQEKIEEDGIEEQPQGDVKPEIEDLFFVIRTLSEKGFSMEQIKQLEPLIKKKYDAEALCRLFEPDMEKTVIEMMVEMLVSV